MYNSYFWRALRVLLTHKICVSQLRNASTPVAQFFFSPLPPSLRALQLGGFGDAADESVAGWVGWERAFPLARDLGVRQCAPHPLEEGFVTRWVSSTPWAGRCLVGPSPAPAYPISGERDASRSGWAVVLSGGPLIRTVGFAHNSDLGLGESETGAFPPMRPRLSLTLSQGPE